MVLFVSLIGSIGTGQGQTWTVCLAGPPTCQFRGIQEALAAASDGDTILVRAGSYRENLVITKSRITLRGDDPRAVRLEAAEPLHAIEIDLSAVGVTIEGFTVRGAGQGQTGNFSGIFVGGAGAILQRNIFQDNNVGILVTNPIKEPVVQILESTFTGNGKDIRISSQALIQGNRFEDEVEVGIGGYAEFRKNQGAILLINGAALVEENRFTQVKVISFAVPGLPTILRRNQIIGTGQNIEEGSPEEGLIIRVSSPLTVEDNLITQHNFSAIVIDRSEAQVLLQRNTITNSGYGLYLIAGFPQFVLRVKGNTIERNQWGGVILLSEDEEARFEIVDNLIRLNQGSGIV
ncbi:MAG: right-handed parallel beta-helix repeat-containing protein, partial [Candidatus Methanosuratincola sp.]